MLKGEKIMKRYGETFMNYMEFYDLSVVSTININGKDVAFDYDNIYTDFDEAMTKAEELTKDNDVLHVAIHRWILKDDGTQEHAENDYINGVFRSSIPFDYINKNHREMRE